MKRLVMSMVIGLGLVTGAQADISVDYNVGYGVVDGDGFSPLLGDGEQALIQLIYAGADGLVDGPSGIGGALSGGDDVLLFQGLGPVATIGDGNFYEYGIFSSSDIGGYIEAVGIPGGYVYGRIFQDDAAALGSYYYEGSLAVMPNIDLAVVPPSIPSLYFLTSLSEVGIANLPVVPEPATLGLISVVGLGFYGARRFMPC